LIELRFFVIGIEYADIVIRLLILKRKEFIIGVGVKKMESIKNVKLGMNPNNMVVTVSADVTMKDKEDPDDLYLVMFNIMDSPLRLSVFTIGNLFEMVKKNTKMTDEQVITMMKSNPEQYIQSAVSNMDNISEYSVENVKIPLDSEKNATKARMVLMSMIDKKHYVQKSTYYIGDEVIEKSQEVETEPLIQQLKMMLEITKRWDGFDPASFQSDIESGVIKL
jgi:hypothetical protein